VGKTGFVNEVAELERLKTLAETADTPIERAQAARMAGAMEARITKETHIPEVVGRTEFDVTGDKPFVRKQMTEVFDARVLQEQLGLARDHLLGLSPFDASRVAQLGVKGLGFMESWFGRKPSETEGDFIDRVVKAQGGSAFVAAQVRHALTGAQMSQFEIQYLEPFLPAPGDNKTRQLAKLAALEVYTQLGADTRAALLSSGPSTVRKFFETQEQEAAIPAIPTVDAAPAGEAEDSGPVVSDTDIIQRILSRRQ
jgi:hypothetical protein